MKRSAFIYSAIFVFLLSMLIAGCSPRPTQTVIVRKEPRVVVIRKRPPVRVVHVPHRHHHRGRVVIVR